MSTPATAPTSDATAEASPRRRYRSACWLGLEWLLVLVVIAIRSAWPVPDVNETQYVLQAEHFWQPAPMAHDFFLQTPATHMVFVFAFGWLTTFLPLEVAVWVGRLLGWMALAWGWQRLSRVVLPTWGIAPLSLALFASLIDHSQMAGEWIFGGIESKAFGYALVFAALADVARNRWATAWLWLGAATLLHVLVGGWSWLLVLPIFLLLGRDRPTPRSQVPTFVLGAFLALGGIIPSLLLTWGVDPLTVAEAHRINVVERLHHHLDVSRFRPDFQLRFGVLAVCFLSLAATTYLVSQGRRWPWQRVLRLHAFAIGSLILAAIGIAITFGLPADAPARTGWLRFYWYRMSDTSVPLATVLGTLFLLFQVRRRARWLFWLALAGLLVASTIDLGDQLQQKMSQPTPRSFRGQDPNRFAKWLEACTWIRQNTPENAVILTPRGMQTFKWYARRAEVVSWKDMPQDARGLVAWWQRLQTIYFDPKTNGFRGSLTELSPAELRQLGRQYGAEYLLTDALPPLALPVLFTQGTDPGFAIYRLADSPAAPASR